MIKKLRFKAVYLLFWLIPALGWFLWPRTTTQPLSSGPDYLFFSVQASVASNIVLRNGEKEIRNWQCLAGGYRLLDFMGEIDPSRGMQLTIGGLKPGDTIKFLGFNLFHKGKIFSLTDRNVRNCMISNARAQEKEGVLKVSPAVAESPVTLQLIPPGQWERSSPENYYKYYLALALLMVFVLIVLIAPKPGFFTVATILSLAAICLTSYHWEMPDGKITFQTENLRRNTEIFYNHNPAFTHLRKIRTDAPGTSFAAGFRLSENPFLRIDAEGTEVLKNWKLTCRLGWFRTAMKASKVRTGDLSLNDLVPEGNSLRVTGPDPFVVFGSVYPTSDIKLLVMLQKSMPILWGVLVMLLFCLISLLPLKLPPPSFRMVYLLFLLLPAMWALLPLTRTKPETEKLPDYLYFSARSATGAQITLFSGADSLTTWNLPAGGYHMLSCVSNLNDTAGIRLRVRSLAAGDTLGVLNFNFFRNNCLYTLYEKAPPELIPTTPNTDVHDKIFRLFTVSEGLAADFYLAPVKTWQAADTTDRSALPVIAAFLLCFTALLYIRPHPRLMVFAIMLVLPLTALMFWLAGDVQDQVTIQTDVPLRSVESYFNTSPCFNSAMKFATDSSATFFRTQVALSEYCYIRCDIDYRSPALKDMEVTVKTGWLRMGWNLTSMPAGNLILNDIEYRGGRFTVTGKDPFIALTTARFSESIFRLIFLRRQAYIFPALLVLMVLLIVLRRIKELKYGEAWIPVMFIAVLALPLLLKTINSDRIVLMSEKRKAKPGPAFQPEEFRKFFAGLESYSNDQLAGRNKVILLNNYLYYSVFGQLLNNPYIYFGRDGWMFYLGAGVKESYENRNPLTDRELYEITRIFAEMQVWLSVRGIRLYICFPRLPHFVYEEMIGSRMYRHHPVSKLDQLLVYMRKNTDLNIIDVYTPVINRKSGSKPELYYKCDSHWNFIGAYYAYSAIMHQIRKDFPQAGPDIPYHQIKWVYTSEEKADLLEIACLTGYIMKDEYTPDHSSLLAATDTLQPEFPGGEPDFPYLYEINRMKTEPSILIFRDSYANYLQPYFPWHFSRCTWLWTHRFEPRLVEQDKPDMVLWEMSERFLYDFLAKNRFMFNINDTLAEP